MNQSSGSVRFLYGNRFGRFLLQCVLHSHVDRVAVAFLRSRFSRFMVKRYTARNHLPLTGEELGAFRSYQDFFVRQRPDKNLDGVPSNALISPCDCCLSAYPVSADSVFAIKGGQYRLADLLEDPDLAARFAGGTCLVFRLRPTDYHHYCYIDDGRQGANHFIPGALHSVQPAALAAYPVFTLNRRLWTTLETEHFGTVVQTAIGALIVGGIVNDRENAPCRRGEEMGHFELAGSTITLLFEPGRMALLPALAEALTGEREAEVAQFQVIGTALQKEETT